jgi:hypothetical protein
MINQFIAFKTTLFILTMAGFFYFQALSVYQGNFIRLTIGSLVVIGLGFLFDKMRR